MSDFLTLEVRYGPVAAARISELEAELARIRNADDTASGRQRDALRAENERLRERIEASEGIAAHDKLRADNERLRALLLAARKACAGSDDLHARLDAALKEPRT